MSKRVFKLDFYGRKIVVENGQLAKQANGAVLVRYGDTVVLSTAVVSKNANLYEFKQLSLFFFSFNSLINFSISLRLKFLQSPPYTVATSICIIFLPNLDKYALKVDSVRLVPKIT